MKTIYTERLILRDWKESDLKDLYDYASSQKVGPSAGWPVHQSEEESLKILKMFIKDQDVFAIELKSENKVIGSIGIHERMPDQALKQLKQREIGYVLNPKYWGNGYIPEAVHAVKAFGFEDLDLDLIWCGHYKENEKSKRVNEKCGFEFRFKRTEKIELLNEEKEVYYYNIRKPLQLVTDKGSENDLDEIEDLYNVLNDYLEQGVNYPGWKKNVYPVREDAEKGLTKGNLYVVRFGKKIVGSFILNHEPETAYSQVEWTFESDYSDVFVIHTFVVHPDYFKWGIGKYMMDKCERIAKLEKMKAIRLDVYEKNSPAIHLYETCGYTFIDTVDLGYRAYGLEWFKLYEKLIE